MDEYLPRENEHAAWMQATPELFLHESFVSEDVEAGVRCVQGTLKDGDGAMQPCAYLFDRGTFSADRAQAWLAGKEIACAKFEPSKDDTYKQMTASAPRQLRFAAAAAIAQTGEVAGSSVTPKLPKIEILAYSGGPLNLDGFPIPVVVNIAGIQFDAEQTPVLKDHDSALVVGHGLVSTTVDTISLSGEVSGTGPAAREVVAAAKNGFKWRSSIGCELVGDHEIIRPGETLSANGQRFEGPILYWPASRLKEISVLGNGADYTSSVSIAARAASALLSTPHSPRSSSLSSPFSSRTSFMDPIFSQWLTDAGFDPAAVAANPTQLRTLTASWRRETSHAELQTDITAVLDETRRELRAVAGAEVSRLNTIAKLHDEVVGAWALDLKDHREIRARAADLRRQATEENWTSERAEVAFLRMGRPQRVVTANYGATEMQPRVLLAAACRSCMMPEAALSRQFDAETLDQASRRYPTIGLKQLLVEAAAARGWSGRWIQNDEDIREVLHYALPPWSPENSRRQLTAEASTFALPGILSSLANKFLYQGFWAVESAWREIAASRPVSDFKPHHSFRFYGDLTYEKVGANGEIKHGSVGELQYVNAAQTYAKMFTTTRQDIRNDDLGALAQLPQAMGMGAAYALNEIFWKLWLGNTQATAAITAGAGGRKAPTVGSSTATFWSTNNTNYISGAASALGSTALTTAEKTFNEQTKPDGHPLGIPAEILLVPPALKNVADRLFTSDKLYEAVLGLASTAAASKDVVPTDNPHKGLFKVVMSRYLSAAIGYTGSSDTAWWLMAAPAVLPCCEIAFLDGQQTPTVQSSEADFNVLGIQHRGFFDFGCALTECRGSLMSAGA